MISSDNNFIKNICTGFVVLMLLSLSLFWMRFIFENNLIEIALPPSAKEVDFIPSRILPDGILSDPNSEHNYFVTALLKFPKLYTLGFINYVFDEIEGNSSNVYWIYNDSMTKNWSGLYFDEKTGQIAFRYPGSEKIPDNIKLNKEGFFYIGPEGFSQKPDKNLGKFVKPLIARIGNYWNQIIIFDKKSKCFFRINFEDGTIFKGSQQSDYEPVQIGLLNKNTPVIYMSGNFPLNEIQTSNGFISQISNIAIQNRYYKNSSYLSESKYLLVLDKSNRIDLLDKETLEFTGSVGLLPAPETLFRSRQQTNAKNLLSYKVIPVFSGSDSKYKGMIAACVNREGTSMNVSVFDSNGTLISSAQTGLREFNESTSKAIYSNKDSDAPILTVMKFSLENLQAPVLSLISYFTANSIEAGSGHRGLFILPNSFVAMKGRDLSEHFAIRFITAILLMLPSIFLSIFLAGQVKKDTAFIGLAKNERFFWVIGTIAFGLVGYIVYRLHKPKLTLVTCQNCGKLRRPDMDRCHHCNAKWHIPELTPPSWRVFETPLQAE